MSIKTLLKVAAAGLSLFAVLVGVVGVLLPFAAKDFADAEVGMVIGFVAVAAAFICAWLGRS
jgi:hypothetical protein